MRARASRPSPNLEQERRDNSVGPVLGELPIRGSPAISLKWSPLCGAPATVFGVEQLIVPNPDVPLMAVACRACGYIMRFNEDLVLGTAAAGA